MALETSRSLPVSTKRMIAIRTMHCSHSWRLSARASSSSTISSSPGGGSVLLTVLPNDHQEERKGC